MFNSSGSDGEYDDGDSIRPRKRQRLTHLSPGEKLQRRKLKNRVAAQAARDRKKAYMDELEDIVAQLQADNKRLADENTMLREQQTCPNCSANTTVLTATQSAAAAQSDISTLVKSASTSKSAALSPQQKDQMQTLLVLMMTLSTLTSTKNCSNCTSTCSQMLSPQEPLDLTMKSQASTLQNAQNIFQPWWGPRQSSWNPTKTV